MIKKRSVNSCGDVTVILLKSSTTTLGVISILIISLLLQACSSSPAVQVSDRSTDSVYKGKIHTVTRGETLFSIAWRYGVDLKKLAYFNNIKPPYTIFPSQKIRLDMQNKKVNTAGSNSASKGNGGDKRDSSLHADTTRSKSGSVDGESASKAKIFYSPLKWQWPAIGKPIALFQGDSGLNKGIDIDGKLGEPVLAAASGRVVYAGSGLSGYGKLLIIKHSEIFLSAYAHNNTLLAKEGDFIKGGQHIADMGSSGTDRVKLHFEIRSEGSPVDPLRYLPKR